MHALADPVPHAGAWWQSDKEQATADAAMRGMHANAQLAYVLSAASAYDATGDSRSRRGVEAFWRQLQSAYTYVAGGSSFQEEWREPRRVAESLRHRGGANWAAHDHQESCVTHNSIALSLRKLAWHRLPTDTERLPHVSSRPARGEASRRGVASALAHADWIERAMHNGVLGTQRGVQPGAMVYMLPQGGGVSKAGGNHGFSRPLDHFWCCVGSGIEAFTRLQHGVFWRHTRLPSGQPPHLVVLQPLISTELLWAEAGCRVTLVADAIGSRLPSLPQRVDIRAAATSPRGNCSLTLSVRVPSWAVRPTARLVHTAQALEASLVAEAGALLSTSLSTTSHLQLELWAQLRLVAASPPATPPSSADDSVLHGLMFGPLLLAALTDGDRRLFQTTEARSITQPPRPIAAPAAWTTEVGEEAREQLATFEWLQQFDRQTKRPTPFSAEPTGRVLSHRGEGSPLSFQQTPPTIPLQPGSRGGSDGANSATWRVTLRPVHNSLGPSTPASLISQPVFLESYDRPGSVATITWRAGSVSSGERGAPGPIVLRLMPADETMSQRQRWWLRPVMEGRSCDGRQGVGISNRLPSDVFSLESADVPGLWISRRTLTQGTDGGVLVERLARDSGSNVPEDAAVLRIRVPLSQYPVVAFWAHSNLSRTATASHRGARKHYLMVPLNSIIDEHYSAYMCVGPVERPLPRFCE